MPNEHLIVASCDVLLKLYESMYVHIPMIMVSILQFFSKVGWPIVMATKWIGPIMLMVMCNCKWKRPLMLLLGLKVIIVAWQAQSPMPFCFHILATR